MSIGKTITALPTWALFILIVIVGILAANVGAWAEHLKLIEGIQEQEASVSTAVSAMLGLLAFLLGFTFSLTEKRFGDRKQLVIRQANAIITCYLRTSLIPEREKREIQKYLHEYVFILLHCHDKASFESAFDRLEELHALIWQQTALLVQRDMDSELRTFFSASVNQVIELFSERKTVAMIFRIPDTIWTTLLLLFMLSMFTMGFQSGNHGMMRVFEPPLIGAAFAWVFVMIADMDNLDNRRFKVSQQPLKDVQQIMQKEIS
jgi:hypothetical protein